MSECPHQRLAVDLVDASHWIRKVACVDPPFGLIEPPGFRLANSAAHAAIKSAIDSGNAAEDDRMKDSLEIAAQLLHRMAHRRSIAAFDPDQSEMGLLVAKLGRVADEIGEATKLIKSEVSSVQSGTPTVTVLEDESVSPFDHLGKKTRLLLNYLWDQGHKPRRSIGTVMKRLGYKISSKTSKSAFRQLRNRANNELFKMPGKPRYIIETHKRENTIFLAELPG